ncbi:MAG: hypothetical protein ACWIPI_05155, partial [Polaribacter sp.]
MKEYCKINHIALPSDTELNLNFAKNKNTSLKTILSDKVFSVDQKNILIECFDSLNLIDKDLSKNNLLLSILNTNLNEVKSHPRSNGKKITIATINQLIASDKLWIVESKINFRNNNNNGYAKRIPPPSNGKVLSSDAKALVVTLVFGGAYTPVGWAGSMFASAGASIGTYMGGSNWWPY